MTILQAVAAGLENTEKRKEPKKKADRYFLDGKVADRELKVCNLCKDYILLVLYQQLCRLKNTYRLSFLVLYAFLYFLIQQLQLVILS